MRYTFAALMFIFFGARMATAQVNLSGYNSSINGWCSKSLRLDSTGIFYSEHGCEGRSHIAYGSYKILPGNIVKLKRLSFDSIPPIKKIERQSQGGDSILTVTFYDDHGQIMAYQNIGRVRDTNKRTIDVFTDEHGSLQLDRKQKYQLFITAITNIYGKYDKIVIDGESKVAVYFGLPDTFFYYPETSVDEFDELEFVIMEDGLYEKDKKTLVYRMAK